MFKNFMLLSLIIIPIIGSLALTFINDNYKVKIISLVISLINLFISAILWIKFNYNCHEWQFIEE